MKYITTDDVGDGFGSQMFSRICGLCYSDYHNLDYLLRPINEILMVDKPTESRSSELGNVNKLLSDIATSFEIKLSDNVDSSDELDVQHRTYFYQQILSNPNQYFNENILKKIQNSYKKESPNYYQNQKLNIAIHIRRGNDIDINDSFRYVNSDEYDKIIDTLLKKFDNSMIHIFSWNDPQISIESDRIVYHITSDGGKEFISDFNGLVHSDILLIGSSTFSLSAAFFNKNIVLCSKNIMRLHANSPFPSSWENNFNTIVC